MTILQDALKDSLQMLPFLFITYLAIEVLEHTAGEKSEHMIRRAGRFGPIVGGLTGIVPQCGFSAAASALYLGQVINIGTLLSVFLATSDEMLPIFISSQVSIITIAKILGSKIAIAIFSGMVLELIFDRHNLSAKYEENLHQGQHAHCENEEHGIGIVLSAGRQSLLIFLYIFLITLVLNVSISVFGEQTLALVFNRVPLLGQMAAALIGLIPNCAGSVLITEFYLQGILSAGSMMSGLLVASGVGLMVLFQNHHHWKEHLEIVAILYGIGVFWGVMIDFVGIVF